MKAKLLKNLRSKYKYKFKQDKVIVLDYRASEIRSYISIHEALLAFLFTESLYTHFPTQYKILMHDLKSKRVQRNFNKI